MAPIKIGFIGLSSGQSWAVWSHLHYLKNNSKYEVVALCNSSIDSAKAAITTHGLPPTTKAYGTPEDLAADPDVELVVCSVRVDKHYDALLPALNAGKDVFCEWPLAKDAAQAAEMVKVAKEKGVKTLLGLQAGVSPTLLKLKQIIDDGKIGKVLSSTFHGTNILSGGTSWESLAYSNDRSIGGNLLTIYAVHSLESIRVVLGHLQTFQTLLAISHPTVQLTSYTGEPTTTVPRTAPDQVLLHGTLGSGAVLSYHLRGGPAFANSDSAGLLWRIYGDKGEIQVTGPNSYLQIADGDVKIEVFEQASGKVEEVAVDKDEFSKEDMPLYARNIARLYEAFADGKKGEDQGVLDWEDALKRHQFVDEVYKKAAF
ncbi:NAD(P)-binding protein [Lentithecium fluviatile CBS 122367]|uniref:NAD(P)-binding protein n=1 Tax=Lentithecium fluviatile CBS 122367 TaxID=1168545 RepID=A0A6G1JBE2_9PLEO|nr:NAD(P)-binding protein [Lentithecium fluviatile CBS 122367]